MTMFALPQAFADEPLKHDPFARPLLPTALSNNTTTLNATAGKEAQWNPQLIAVMVAGQNSLVDLDGVILKIGEEIDGYRLVQVRDSKAVFRKGSKRIEVDMEVLPLRKNEERGVK